MKYRIHYLVLMFLMACNMLFSQEVNNFEQELQELGTNTALIISSQAIDEYPIWSPRSDYVGVNISGKWHKVGLNKIKLEKGQWRKGQIIGLVKSNSSLEEMSIYEVMEFKKVSKVNNKVKTKNGIGIELKPESFGVSFIFIKKDEKPRILWTTDLEVCHSLVLSPNQEYVAFLSELNGLIVMKLL